MHGRSRMAIYLASLPGRDGAPPLDQGSDTPEVAGSDGKPGFNRFFGNKILGKTETMKIIDTRNSTFEVQINVHVYIYTYIYVP